MKDQKKEPLHEHTKNDSSDIERVKADKARFAKEGNTSIHSSDTAPPEPEESIEDEEAEKGHS